MSERLKINRLLTCDEEGLCAKRTQHSLLAVMASIFFVSILFTPLAAGADPIELFYDSFETPDVATASNSSVPPGWVKEHSYSGMWDVAWGGGWISTAYGQQGIKCWQNSGFYTTNITEKLQPGATYTLTFNVGNTSSDTGIPYTTGGGLSYSGYIMAGTNVVGSVTGKSTLDNMSQTNVVVLATTGATPYLGQALRIRLKDNGTEWHWQTLFDNVRLTVSETTEYKETMFYGK